jgi:hypothetical protein
MSARWVPIALVTLLQATGCAQVKKATANESLADRVTVQIATTEIIKAALNFRKPTWSAVQAVIEPLEESLDFKVARILVAVYDYEPERVESVAGAIEIGEGMDAKISGELAADPKYTDNLLVVHAFEMKASNEARVSEQHEMKVNEAITPEKAALVMRTAQKLKSLRNERTLTALAGLKTAVAQAIARHPEQLKPFSERKPASKELLASRARTQKLLQAAVGG